MSYRVAESESLTDGTVLRPVQREMSYKFLMGYSFTANSKT
jgi:hypothetical protein